MTLLQLVRDVNNSLPSGDDKNPLTGAACENAGMSEDPPTTKLYRPGRPPSKYQTPADTKIEREVVARIEAIRKESGHTHESFGREIGYTKQGYANIANGKVRVSVDRIAQMAEALGHHLHIAIRAGAGDAMNALERAALRLAPEPLCHVIRIAQVADKIPPTVLAGTADYFETIAAQAAPASETTTATGE